MTVEFLLAGQRLLALNGGPAFSFTKAVSLIVDVDSQEELDIIWNHHFAHPEAEQCSWLKDRFGLSWQVIPTIFEKLMTDKDPVKAGRVTQAMLKRKKLDIAKLKAAFDGVDIGKRELNVSLFSYPF